MKIKKILASFLILFAALLFQNCNGMDSPQEIASDQKQERVSIENSEMISEVFLLPNSKENVEEGLVVLKVDAKFLVVIFDVTTGEPLFQVLDPQFEKIVGAPKFFKRGEDEILITFYTEDERVLLLSYNDGELMNVRLPGHDPISQEGFDKLQLSTDGEDLLLDSMTFVHIGEALRCLETPNKKECQSPPISDPEKPEKPEPPVCGKGYHVEKGACVLNIKFCSKNSKFGIRRWQGKKYSKCAIKRSRDYNFKRIRETPPVKKVKFNKLAIVDFDGDGIPDPVICNGRNPIQILKGKKKKRKGKEKEVLFSYQYNTKHSEKKKAKRNISKCDIVMLGPNRPAIVVASLWGSKHGRYRATQLIVYKDKNGFKAEPIKIKGKTLRAVARSVKCTKLPKKFKGGGAICFFASYFETTKESNYSYSTMIKIEQNGGKIRFKDITKSVGLPWDGMKGTHKNRHRTYKYCDDYLRHDGRFMMDSAFLDFDGDGLKDLITVGQHASIRSHRMYKDDSSPEGFRYQTSYVLKAYEGVMTEFLRVFAFDEIQKNFASQCVYISGEKSPSVACGKVTDHIRCYEKGAWKRYSIPKKRSSEGAVIGVNINPINGHLLFRVPRPKKSGGVEVKYFQVPFKKK